MPTELKQLEFAGWPNCYQLSNGTIQLIVTTDVGPHIISFGFEGGMNEMWVTPELMGKMGGDDWKNYGGHRLWNAPEVDPDTYAPDNGPVELAQYEDFIRVTQPIEELTGIQKEMDIQVDDEGVHVRVIHRLRNFSGGAKLLSPWSITAYAGGGTGIIPLPPRGAHADGNFQATARLTLWPYTNMTDPRWTWGEKYILLKHDANAILPQKIGIGAETGWCAYATGGRLIVKTYDHVEGSLYPDMGASCEVYTDANVLELEALSPMIATQRGVAIEHVEDWYLFDGVPTPSSDADVDEHILPKVEPLLER